MKNFTFLIRRNISFFVITSWLSIVVTAAFSFADSGFDEMANSAVTKDFIVERVIRADVILLDNEKKIRLIGLIAPDAPKSKIVKRDNYGIVIEEQSPETTLNNQAFDFAKKLLENKHVRLEFDFENKDENFYTLAYVFLSDGTLANAEILRQGYANLKIVPPNTKYADTLRTAYQEARRERRGLQGE